ncbi:restriction endonuclease subunit S [Vibrio parahaemolyticus]|uniref:restriction endonuclease subunit S n=1 Tax=Vibrio parahaemolyticus TaxID=670 RepID=UPI000B7851C0|nr:restriction endonuclease subunit S [Vibrio parahaemolyticus]MCZ6416876.1 restriction endonuclease subunit S [Vibrio parahaemolyticus]MCZ6421922.1 restriction endonuclease subunit S [Vibrio parahaemolyticus]MDF4861124.1 restriction endonuclease subunit S [Vibrio parahaemolyticus]MDF5212522.1 restriction endonuclease subunit S [Vibrio parahaemolyticus]MDG2712826.1 restriction endonuclease subunit S [Vibrio parahaemolyticus]
MTEKTNVPKLRFSEFSSQWEPKKLGVLSTIRSASRVHREQWTESGVPFFRSSDVVAAYKGNDNTRAFISNELFEELSKKSGKPKKDDLLVTGGGSIGIPYLIPNDEPLYFKDADLLWFKNKEALNGYFLYQFLITSTFRRYLASITHTGTISHYTIEQAKSTPIVSPALPEQQKIASFLSKVDEKIALLTEKKDKLIEYKKGVMQQLFNGKWQDKDGQLIFIPPTLRFKADDGSEFPDWEERKLGDVLTIGNGRDYKHLSDGDIPVFGTGGYMTSVDGYLHDGETVFIGRKGTINKPYMFNGKFWTVDTLFYTKDFKDILPKFVYAIFQKVNWSLYNEATGVPSLSKSTINKIRLNLPSLSEQEKITEFISSLDQKIDLVNEELEKAKEWKRGLLQQMFV